MVPSTDAIEDLDEFLEPRRAAAPFRLAPPEQWHLTLAFMADVAQWRVEDLVDRLADVAARRTPFELSLHGGGAFPDAARAKVVWCGVAGAVEQVDALAQSTRAAANAAGARPDGGRFRAHLTMGRLSWPDEVSNWVRLLDTYSGPVWRAESLTLFASHLGEGPRRRPRHEVLAELPFGSDIRA
nr:RNA 2',3'-cyclic phosphodiesterase [Nocardioides daedukensis]